MTDNKTRKSLPMFWILLLGSMPILAFMLWLQPEREPLDPQVLPWNAYYDNSGQLHALGLQVGKSTLQDAVDLYGKDVEVKLFSEADESNKSVEAFFPVMYIGSIKAGLALRLNASAEHIEQAYSNGKKTQLTSSGAREVELYSEDVKSFLNSTIHSVTLVPRKNLDQVSISKRFGEPDRKVKQDDGLEHWFFNKLGLEMIIDPEGPEALQYTQTPA